jgi:H+-transporting ATPase
MTKEEISSEKVEDQHQKEASSSSEKLEQDVQEQHKTDMPAIQQLTVEELYDKDKYDLSTMEPGDVFALLQ